MKSRVLVTGLLILTWMRTSAAECLLKDGDLVAVIGDSITEQ